MGACRSNISSTDCGVECPDQSGAGGVTHGFVLGRVIMMLLTTNNCAERGLTACSGSERGHER
jgi:hypothetical protein